MAEIYAITDDILTPENSVLSQVRELLLCGVKFIQFRSKKEPKNKDIARELLKICDEYNAKFIINDDVNFASAIGARCVHLGKDDASVRQARRILGDEAFIGVSCYGDLELALKAQDEGASYAAFGAMFKSQTKPNAPLCSIKTLAKAKELLQIPICAIGGINAQNISQILALNIDMIALINAVYKPNDISQNILNLRQAMGKI